MKENAELAKLVERLAAPPGSPEANGALKDLRAVEARGIDAEAGAFLLRAAARPYPATDLAWQSPPSALVSALLRAPRPEYVPVVREVFDRLDARAQVSALDLLARVGTGEAAGAFMALLQAHRRDGALPWELRLQGLRRKPHAPEVYFPALADYATGANTDEVLLACLSFAEAGLAGPDVLAALADKVLGAYGAVKAGVVARQGAKGLGWVWDEDYAELRRRAGIVLDLLGHLPGEAVDAELAQATALRDPRLRMFAAFSLLRRGRPVPAATLEAIAASPAERGSLFATLRALGKEALFPEKWLGQKALAESEMVRWLAFPTELGRAPDEIELMRVESLDTGADDGVLDWYLFRFRTHPPHWSAKDGWMAGVAGPFKRKEAPSTKAYGDTFSSFDKWAARTPEQHVAGIRELMQKWRKEIPR